MRLQVKNLTLHELEEWVVSIGRSRGAGLGLARSEFRVWVWLGQDLGFRRGWVRFRVWPWLARVFLVLTLYHPRSG